MTMNQKQNLSKEYSKLRGMLNKKQENLWQGPRPDNTIMSMKD